MIDLTKALVPYSETGIKSIRLLDNEYFDTRVRFTLEVEVEGYPTAIYMAIPAFYVNIFKSGSDEAIAMISQILGERLASFLQSADKQKGS